jgi:hypothetical protein
MSDTVLILGAGFSKAAGIPLLGDFVKTMWDLEMRGRMSEAIAQEDRIALSKAKSICRELDDYHGRAHFDDRNIEDILSILSFNVLAGGKRDEKKLKAMTNAIARTIEICCNVKHPGIQKGDTKMVTEGHEMYRNFWKAIFSANAKGHGLPAIITFNYDLVLERSLLQLLVGTEYDSSQGLPFDSIQFDYHFKPSPVVRFGVTNTRWEFWMNDGPKVRPGTNLEVQSGETSSRAASIELLKLHGSLNFLVSSKPPSQPSNDITTALVEPFILPPVFNKLAGKSASSMWAAALHHLRAAKNVVIVGYSLPQTDNYMQYFLKASLGPNVDLDKLVVFDPVLFSATQECDDMKHWYESCFSAQLRKRIVFEPKSGNESQKGTAEAFVNMLGSKPNDLLF